MNLKLIELYHRKRKQFLNKEIDKTEWTHACTVILNAIMQEEENKKVLDRLK